MPKTRVFELAKEIGVDVKTLMEYLTGLGAKIKSQNSMVDDTYAELARRRFAPASELPTLTVKAVQPRPVGMPPRSRRGPIRKTATSAVPSTEETVKPVEAKAVEAKAVEAKAVDTEPTTPPEPEKAPVAEKAPVEKAPTKPAPAAAVVPATPPADAPTTQRAAEPKERRPTPPRSKKPAARRSVSAPEASVKKTPERPSPSQRAKRDANVPDTRSSNRPVSTPSTEDERRSARAKHHVSPAASNTEEKRQGTRRAGRTNIGRPGRYGTPRNTLGVQTDVAQTKKRRGTRKQAKPVEPPTPKDMGPKKLVLPNSLTVADLAKMLDLPASTVIKTLMSAGVMAAINHVIDRDVAAIVAEKHDAIVEKPQDDEQVDKQEPKATDKPGELENRPPVITILGHVDHGKTTLLDAIRESKVVESEAGGITQHIGAYQVEKDGRKISFLDTPGHEAFTEMRSRGAQVTDIAVLVVAADDGVMPQTREAIHHARAAEVPIVVAVNKIDRPGANPDRVKQQLADEGLLAEDWGGDTVMVEVSALQKLGIDDLLEMILLVADMRELKANPNRPAEGRVIEAELDKNRGPVATVLVQNGTLKLGDALVAGMTAGKVRAMFDYRGRSLNTAGPSTPVAILGLNDVPAAGDLASVVESERIARQMAEERFANKRADVQKSGRLRLSELYSKIQEGEVKDLNIVLKADVKGTAEALGASLEKLTDEKVRVNVIHSGAGGISETDVALAAAANGIIIGFNVRPDPTTRRAAEREEVDIRLYRVIYEAIDDVKAAMTGMLDPTFEEVVLGRADVRATFRVPNIGTVAGCYVSDGKILRNSSVRILRDSVIIFEGKISSLKRFKDDAREVAEGYECGIGIERFNDIKEGDVIEAYQMQEVKRQ